MPRAEWQQRLLGLSVLTLATLVSQFHTFEACVPKRELEARLGLTVNGPAVAQAQIQTRISALSEDALGLGLVARSILGVTPRSLPASSTNEVIVTSSSTPSSRRATEPATPSIEDNSIKYKDRYDFVSIDHVLKSPRLMHNFHQCVMGRGPCTSEAAELRRIIPEAMRSECARCTERQRQQAGRVLAYILEHRPEWLQELFEKFDPDGSIRKKYEYEVDYPEVETPQQ